MKNDKGFTLIELVVVIVILGILAAVAIPRYSNRRVAADNARIDADIKVLQNAVDMYYADKQVYPTGDNATGIQILVNEGYLNSVPETIDGAGDPTDTIQYDDATGKVSRIP